MEMLLPLEDLLRTMLLYCEDQSRFPQLSAKQHMQGLLRLRPVSEENVGKLSPSTEGTGPKSFQRVA